MKTLIVPPKFMAEIGGNESGKKSIKGKKKKKKKVDTKHASEALRRDDLEKKLEDIEEVEINEHYTEIQNHGGSIMQQEEQQAQSSGEMQNQNGGSISNAQSKNPMIIVTYKNTNRSRVTGQAGETTQQSHLSARIN